MSGETTPETPVAPEQVLGAAVPAEPAKAAVEPTKPANANGTAPAPGQTQAEANAKAAEALAAKEAAARTALDAEKAAKDKDIADKHAADKLWAEHKFKAPEGVALDDKQVKSFAELARAEGLKPEQAQKFIDFQAQAVKGSATAAVQSAQLQRGKDLATLKSDPTLGGEKWDASLRTANKVLDRFGTPEMKQYLAATMQDANPHFFKLLHTIGLAMQDDRIADGAGLGGARSTKPGFASLFNHPTSVAKR